EHLQGDSAVQFRLIFDSVRGTLRRRLNTCPGSFPDFADGLPPFAFHCCVLDPRAAIRPARPKAVALRIPREGVTGHHPYCLFTRVITVRCSPRDGLGWDWTGRCLAPALRA